MIAVGRTWSNLMVSVVATNEKLRLRTVRILQEATGLEHAPAIGLLAAADGDLKTAIVAELGQLGIDEARRRLDDNGGSVRAALIDSPH